MSEFSSLLEELGGPPLSVDPRFLQFDRLSKLIKYLENRRIPLSRWGYGRAKTVPTLFNQLSGSPREARLFDVQSLNKRKIYTIRAIRVLALRIGHTVSPGETVYDTSEYAYKDGTVVHVIDEPHDPRPLTKDLTLVEFRQEYGRGPFMPGRFIWRAASETWHLGERSPARVAIRALIEELGFAPSSAELDTLTSLIELADTLGIGRMQKGDKLAADLPEINLPLEPGFVRYGPSKSKRYPGLGSIKDISPYAINLLEHFDPNGYIEVDDDKITVFKWIPVHESTHLKIPP